MEQPYPVIDANPLDPNELFKFHNRSIGFPIVDFWRWNQSDLIENRNRGILAEFIVKSALRIEADTRLEWDAHDFETNDKIKIEVKSAAYIQAWEQTKLSAIQFDIAPKKQLQKDNNYSEDRVRSADVYIFCLLHHKDQDSINPMELSQWTFYLVLTKDLDAVIPMQKSISISTIEMLPHRKCDYAKLRETFDDIIRKE